MTYDDLGNALTKALAGITPETRSPRECFYRAVEKGILSSFKNDDNFAGDYKYIGIKDGADCFKHKKTGEYKSC